MLVTKFLFFTLAGVKLHYDIDRNYYIHCITETKKMLTQIWNVFHDLDILDKQCLDGQTNKFTIIIRQRSNTSRKRHPVKACLLCKHAIGKLGSKPDYTRF